MDGGKCWKIIHTTPDISTRNWGDTYETASISADRLPAACLEGFEPPTYGSVDHRSNPLSYRHRSYVNV